jgi:hypothetical protein
MVPSAPEMRAHGHEHAVNLTNTDTGGVYRGIGGKMTGVLVKINAPDGVVHIAVLTDAWPEGLTTGARLWVNGRLGHEKEVTHRRNLHDVAVEPIAIVPRNKTKTAS